jgi:hypothetical protein
MSSSGYKNPFKKAVLDVSEKSFPSLSSKEENVQQVKVEWAHTNGNRISDNAKIYPNGDTFDGYYDEDGLPIWGKLTFINGNTYEGPIQSSWDKSGDRDDLVDEPGDYYDSYYDEYFDDGRIGVFTTPAGKQFYGVFCFGDKNKW